MRIVFDKATKAIIMTMVAFVIIAIFWAKKYYGNINSAIDPRIVPARQLYAQYNSTANSGDYNMVFQLLDSVEAMYTEIPHYSTSYEIGVIENNRAAALLTIALYRDSVPQILPHHDISKDSIFSLAEVSIIRSINNYENWLNTFQNKSSEEILSFIKGDFLHGLDNYTQDEQNKFLEARVLEIEKAQLETKRRLSVSYTNLGVVNREKENYEETIKCYKKALELWDKNLTAENNLNKLTGQPLSKRNFIQRMFPQDKDKE